jgi:hypothetical protein
MIGEKTMTRSPTRKRPCRVCKRWFIPHPRLKDRQKTCGDQQCQREWHRRKCEQWNHNNVDYFKDNYLDKKLEQTGMPRSRLKTGLPLCYVQQLIGTPQLIIIEYLSQLLLRRCRHLIRPHPLVNGPSSGQLPTSVFLRGDTHSSCCNQ